jgi:hypothetical protein
MNQLPNIEQQMQAVNDFFCRQADQGASPKIHFRGGVGSMSQQDIGACVWGHWSSIFAISMAKSPAQFTTWC